MNKNKIFYLGLAILFLLCFYLFSREVKHGFLKQTDFNFTVVLQNHVPAKLDTMWDAIALPVTPTPSIIVIIFITIIFFIKANTWKKRAAALGIPILFGLLVLGEIYGKSVVQHPAPPFFMIKNPTTIFPQFYINEQYQDDPLTIEDIKSLVETGKIVERKKGPTQTPIPSAPSKTAAGKAFEELQQQ